MPKGMAFHANGYHGGEYVKADASIAGIRQGLAAVTSEPHLPHPILISVYL